MILWKIRIWSGYIFSSVQELQDCIIYNKFYFKQSTTINLIYIIYHICLTLIYIPLKINILILKNYINLITKL